MCRRSPQLGEDVRWRLVHAARSCAPLFHGVYQDSINTNPNFYFVSLSGLRSHHLECHYFHAGFFTNGTIGAGRVAIIASTGSFN
jgi:hypothetical protein